MGDARVPAPPRSALRLAETLIDERMREGIVGDLVESFTADVAARGLAAARRRFVWQAALGIARFPVRLGRSHSTGDDLMTGFLGDLAFGVRTLRRAPAYTILCAATLGIGVGAATAIFSVADPIIIRPLPYAQPDRAFIVWENDQAGARSNVGFATFADLRDGATDFSSTAALGGWQPVLNKDGTAEQLQGLRVSWTYFKTLGVQPARGADFTREDDAQGHNGVIILSDALWRTRFGGDTAVVGRFADIGGIQMRIAGIMPRDYDDVLSPGAQIWRVLGYDTSLPYACRSCRHLRMVARLAAAATSGAALAQIDAMSAHMIQDFPHDYPARGFQMVGLQAEATRGVRPALGALLAGVALLLIIAAVNVSGLQLARALRRDEEFSIRAALGAGSGRLTRQLVAEGLVLASVALVIGLVVAKVGLVELINRLPARVPRLSAVRLDYRAFGFAAVVTIASGLVLGLAPAWHARRRGLADSLRGGRRLAGAPHRLRGVLVIAEVAVAVTLLAGAGLLARSLALVLSVNPGFNVANVATAAIQVSGARYNDTMAVFAWQDQLLESVRRVPGVTSAAFVNQLPLGGGFDSYGIQAEDKPLANPELAPSGDRYTVSTDFLRTMGIGVVEGRDFTHADNAAAAAPVAIVSRSLAKQIWGEESPIGKRVHCGEPTRPWYTVIGVAGDIHHRGLDNGTTMQLYVPTHRWFFSDTGVDVVVRTAGDPEQVLGALRRAVLSPDPGTVITRLATMADVRSQSTAQRSLALTLFGCFAAIALLLAAAGLFGALAGAVAERGREIGLRTALGASPSDIINLVLRSGLGLAAAGVGLGLMITLAGAGTIRAMLFGVGSADLLTFAGAVIVMGIAAALASIIPAWRALRVDPIAALRSD
ncbi:MAG TPA: ABC transporter permease [Gemmatimonadales bacterium]|jgi:putative ABC transport system permease protein